MVFYQVNDCFYHFMIANYSINSNININCDTKYIKIDDKVMYEK